MSLVDLYRRTGADLPCGDPLTSHGCEMEGWFWRVTDAASGRVAVALFSINRHPDGDCGTVAVAAHPGDLVRAAAFDDARAGDAPFELNAGSAGRGTFTATYDALHVELDDVVLDLRFDESYEWPKALAGGGIASSSAGGGARHTTSATTTSPSRSRAAFWRSAPYAPTSPVSLSGLGQRVIRLTSPTAWVRSELGDGRWSLRARSLRYHVEIDGDGVHRQPHALPVPLPGERRNVNTDYEHLAGRLRSVVKEFGRVVFDGQTELAGLEVGSLPP